MDFAQGYEDWRYGPPQLAPLEQTISQSWAGELTPLTWAEMLPNPPQDNEFWKKTWRGATTLPEIFMIDKQPWRQNVQGWTVCNKDDKACQIFIDKRADRQFVEEHEKRHAAGWDHPNYPESFFYPRPGFLR